MIRMRVIARKTETESGKIKTKKEEERDVQCVAAAAINEHQTPIGMIITSFLLRRGKKGYTGYGAGRSSRSSSSG